MLALAVDLGLGLIVFFTNRTRTANRLYFMACCAMAAWLGCVLLGINVAPGDAGSAALCIRGAFACAASIPYVFLTLRFAILQPEASAGSIIRMTRWPLVATLGMSIICFTPLFMRGVEFPEPDASGRSLANPLYGPGFGLFGLYGAAYLIPLIYILYRDIRRSVGMRRAELQFIALGCGAMVGTAILLGIIVPALTHSSASAPFTPLSVLFLTGFVAYGIATHRIMEVSHVLRRLTAYNLLAVYLVVVYAAVYFLTRIALTQFGPNLSDLAAHILATVAVAFSMAPATTRFQDIARRLFLNVQSFNFGETVQQANRLLGSINTLDELTGQFCHLLGHAFGTDRVSLYLVRDTHLHLHHARGIPVPPDTLDPADPSFSVLVNNREPVVLDVLNRLPPSPDLAVAAQALTRLEAAVAVGIHTKDRLAGLLLLGPRLSGRIYGSQEQEALRVLGDNLAVAIENARLYTEVQDGKRYNEALLENMVSGVIAAGTDRRITVFNREAQRVTHLDAALVLGQKTEVLPAPLCEALRATVEMGQVSRDQEVSWRQAEGGEETTVRVGGTRLHSHTGQALGALLVFHDMSAIKKLEAQVRRTDRLASLGTLSAGMAHEIKNPLVTLKTFTQLLPERYDDPDFRNTFSTLLGEEVRRIDSLVNQLLRFARPTKPSLHPLRLHEVAAHVLKLVDQQARQKNIACTSDLQAAQDLIQGDRDLLVQAMLNFLFNAIDAMTTGGKLIVSTDLHEQETPQMGLWGQPTVETYIRLSVRDTGPGIKADDLPHVFDPFFTTKSSGTGLGLSVAHGIIQEHRGLIDVESVSGQGTVFHLLFPLSPKEAAV